MRVSELTDKLAEVKDREAKRFGEAFGRDMEPAFLAGFYQCQVEVMGLLIKEQNYGNFDLPKV